jgi:putative ABC transport system permease protein
VGIAEFPFEARGQAAAKITIEAYRAARIGPDRDEADMLLVASKDPARSAEAVEAIRRIRPDLTAFSIEELLERLRRTDFSYFRQISLVLSAITSFFAGLLVTTLLTVSVNQRLGEIAALRALGFSRLRVGLDLLAESALLLAAGGLLAIPLGALVAWVLDSILREMPGLPEQLHFFAADPSALVRLAAILAVSAVLAAIYPIWIASRLPIADTLRREVVS